MRVAICIATYDRPAGLERLLAGIAGQIFRKADPPRIDIVVVDNAPSASGEATCTRLRGHIPFPVRYVVEPRRGIPFARNTAVANAPPDTDFLAFIDDDEVPEPTWLDELLHAQQIYEADAVSGPVLPYFPSVPARWMVAGNFFCRRRYPTGYQLTVAATNNVLVKARILKELGEPFAAHFAFTGGSDYHLFERLARSGIRIIWTDTAIVHEWIPASRAKLSWILRRTYRTSISNVRRRLEFEPSPFLRGRCFVKGIVWVAMGVSYLPISLVNSARDDGVRFVKGLRKAAEGSGMIAGALGRVYEEYRHVHRV